MTFATWLNVGLAFIRSCLQSYLAFGWLAVLDTVESSIRTATWLIAAWWMPSKMGLAWATLFTAVAGGVLALVLLLARTRRDGASAIGAVASAGLPKQLVHDSAKFFGVGLATRVFLSGPLILFGQILGADVVGVIGAFTRLLDMITFPFIIIGNALAVRAYEVKESGMSTIVALWNASCRFIVLAAGAAGATFVSASLLASAVIPDTATAPALFAVLSIMVLTHSSASFLSPMADFVGGLGDRVIFLSTLALVQLPVLWVAATYGGDFGAVVGYCAGNVIMLAGYLWISKNAFFGKHRYFPPAYIRKSFVVIGVCIAVTFIACRNVEQLVGDSSIAGSFLGPLVYACLLAGAFVGVRELRERFLSLSVFEFTRT
jgi:O-antigen/teichoic acid export membrane protein